MSTPENTTDGLAKPMTRDELRALVLGAKPATQDVTYNGAKLELVEPSVGEVLDFQNNEDRKLATAMMIVRYLHVPGTGERLLEEADVETILSAPFSKDFQDLIGKINQMIGVSVTADDKSGTEAQPDALDNPDAGA